MKKELEEYLWKALDRYALAYEAIQEMLDKNLIKNREQALETLEKWTNEGKYNWGTRIDLGWKIRRMDDMTEIEKTQLLIKEAKIKHPIPLTQAMLETMQETGATCGYGHKIRRIDPQCPIRNCSSCKAKESLGLYEICECDLPIEVHRK